MSKLCPKCRQPGYGPYAKVIKGHKYQYMQHWSSEKRGRRWCYLGVGSGALSSEERLRAIIRAKGAAKRMLAGMGMANRLKPEDLLSRRTPGELAALIRIAKASFDRNFERVGPREYRFRDEL